MVSGAETPARVGTNRGRPCVSHIRGDILIDLKKRPGYVTLFSFTGVLVLVEALSRFVSPSLPVDPGKWPRIEIAQKLDQMRTYVNDGAEVDVVFAGSSMVAGGVDPVEFNQVTGL